MMCPRRTHLRAPKHRSDHLVDADVAARAARSVDPVHRVPGALVAPPGSPLQGLVVLVVGGQRAAPGLVDELFGTLCQGNHSSVVRIRNRRADSTKPTSGYATSIIIDFAPRVKAPAVVSPTFCARGALVQRRWI